MYRNDHRLKLDRRRLVAAHLRYAVLMVKARYPDICGQKCMLISASSSEAVHDVTPKFFEAFMSKYAGKKLVCESLDLYKSNQSKP